MNQSNIENQHPYDEPFENSRLRNLVDRMNQVIEHHQSLAGPEGAEGLVKKLQKLLFRTDLPKEVRNRILPFYMQSQLRAKQGKSIDMDGLDKVLRGAEEACKEDECLTELSDLTTYTRALVEQSLKSSKNLSPDRQLKEDLYALVNVNPVHRRVRNYFWTTLGKGPIKPLKFNQVLKELKEDWDAHEGEAEKAKEKRHEDITRKLIELKLREGSEINQNEAENVADGMLEEILLRQREAEQEAPETHQEGPHAGGPTESVFKNGPFAPQVPQQAETQGDSISIDLGEFGPMMKAPLAGEAPSDFKVPETKKTDPESPPVREVAISIEIEDDGASKASTTRKQIEFPEHEAAQEPIKLKETSTAQEAFELGNEASKDANFKLARQYFEQAINMDPEFRLAYEHLAYTLENLGELPLSEKYHRIATEMEAKSLIKSPEQALQAGDDFTKRNDYEKALECYGGVFTDGFNPTPKVSSMAYYGQGVIFYKRGDLETAKHHFKEAHDIDPNNIHPCRYLGLIFETEHDFQSANIYYNQALEIDPDNQWVKEHLEQIQLQQVQQAAKSVTGDSFDGAFTGLADELTKQHHFQETETVTPSEDTACGEPSLYHAPDTGQLNGIGLPVELEKPPVLPPDAVASTAGDLFDKIAPDAPPPPFGTDPDIDGSDLAFIREDSAPDVRGQTKKLHPEELEKRRPHAKERLHALKRVFVCKEPRTAEELLSAVEGYIELVKTFSCLKDVNHREFALIFRDLWKQKVFKDFRIVDMAHSQDISVNKGNPEEHFKAMAEFGRSYFETNTIKGYAAAEGWLFQALQINPKPKGDYVWVKGWFNEIKGRVKLLEEKQAQQASGEQPVKVEEDFESSPTVIGTEIPEEVQRRIDKGMDIFTSRTRKFIPGLTKVQREPSTIPQARSLQQRLKEQMGDFSADPPTAPNRKIPIEIRDEDILPPALGVKDNQEFRKEAVELRMKYLETNDPVHKEMLKNTILKKHVDDINHHRKLSTAAYLQLGISFITFGDKVQARRALNEALKLAEAKDEQTLMEEINSHLGKLNEKAV